MTMLGYKLLLSVFFLAVVVGCTPVKSHVITKTDFSQSRYCVMLLVDGLGPDLLEKAIADGDIPNIQKHIVDRGMMARNMLSVLPSITAAAIPTMLTGVYPGRHQQPNFQWVDRKSREFRSYIGVDIGKMETDLDKKAKTIFRYLPADESASFGLIYGRQAGKDDSLMSTALNPFYRNAPLKHVIVSDFFSKLGLGKGIPHFMAIYEWGVDVKGHYTGKFAEKPRQVLRDLDSQFGDIVKAYQDRGLYGETYFLLASDHGLAPSTDRFFIDDALNNAGFHGKLISYNLGESMIPTSWARADSIWFSHDSVSSYNTVIGSSGGGAATLDFVLNEYRDKDGAPTAKSWAEHPVYEDLLKFRLGKEALPGQATVNVIRFLKDMDPIDFFIVRENRPKIGETAKVLLISSKGMSRITRRLAPHDNKYSYSYEVLEGEDTLGYSADPGIAPLMRAGFHDVYAWREATAGHAYPDIPVLVTQIFDTPRSGTVFISMKAGWGMNSEAINRHGGSLREEMLATFCISGPGLSKGDFHTASIVDITPTILALLLVDYQPGYFDGRAIPEIMEKVKKPRRSEGNTL